MLTAITIVFAAAFLLCWAAVLRYDIQMFQQNSYKPHRYMDWLKAHMLGHYRWTFIAGLGLVWNKYLALVAVLGMVVYALVEFRTKYKIKIAYTARVIRLYVTTVILGLVILIPLYLVFGPYVAFYAALLILIFSKFLVLLGNLVNSPVENAICKWYVKDAAKILAERPDLIVIGITGSYGKTSTKNFLYRILSEKYNTLITPGNYNTLMGVVRTIREKLQPQHQVFIVEMGAKEPGDIREICDLVHPKMGIVTSVGPMHLETFKTIENIQRTKFELIESLPSDGLGVINIDSAGIASYAGIPSGCTILKYAINSPAAYRAEGINYTPNGTDFTIVRDTEASPMHTQLLGDCNVLNILAACAIADNLGVSASQVQIATAKLQPVEHRLAVSQKGGFTILDDAYNSNPEGAKMALDVLQRLSLPYGAKRIVVTPGFVELGRKQEDACYELGSQIAQAADILIIVNKLNKSAIHKGAVKGGMKKDAIICCATLDEAALQVQQLARVGDAVLYENDLPDTFK